MSSPLFTATERFDQFDGQAWKKYIEWAKIPSLIEVVSLDSSLCKRVVNEFSEEDWKQVVCEDYGSFYFKGLDYLLMRVQSINRRNILGLYRNPEMHIVTAPLNRDFKFMGYDLVEDRTQISALTNCGGFPDVFDNEALNPCGLISDFEYARKVRELLAKTHPEEPHANCEMYAVWRLNEDN